jgi:hypothetical protein
MRTLLVWQNSFVIVALRLVGEYYKKSENCHNYMDKNPILVQNVYKK